MLQGMVEKERLYSFNLPIYGPSIAEVTAVVKQSELYDINHIQLFESNWESGILMTTRKVILWATLFRVGSTLPST